MTANERRLGAQTEAANGLGSSSSTVPSARRGGHLPLSDREADATGRFDDVGAPETADPGWRLAVDSAIEALAKTGRPFTVDDVRALGVAEPGSPNSWGHPFAAANRLRIIEPVAAAPSARRSRHSGLRREWRGSEHWRSEAPA